MSLFQQYQQIIENAIKAQHERTFFAQYPEHPKAYPEDGDKVGQEKFKSTLNGKFEELRQPQTNNWIGEEDSPYLGESLNISYPAYAVSDLIENADIAFHQWRKVTPEDRAGILIDSLEKIKERFFEIAYATMHTTGQGYMMAFQASGPHANDRALEAIASGYEELKRVPESAVWDKPMGKFNIVLNKTWKPVPKGINLVIGCSTFPIWNSVPGIYAGLITGNSVIVKPHPKGILPLAIVVAEIQKALEVNGYSANICQLAVDTPSNQITKDLANDDKVKLIDYTGSATFGNYLEGISDKVTFTEKTGVNSVILDSTDNIDKVVQNLAFSVSLYSGQMCTAPQNFLIPESGIKTPDGVVSYEEFSAKFSEAVNGLVENPKAGPFVLGAIQNPTTVERVTEAERKFGEVELSSKEIENPMFKNARVKTPVVLKVDASSEDVFSKELFGPIALMIKTKDTDQSIQIAAEMARKHGAISCAAYTMDQEVKEKVMDEMGLAGTSVSFNLTGAIYVNQNAGFSDFHVTGGNPAGNASFTNPEFVIKRFTWVGFREPA